MKISIPAFIVVLLYAVLPLQAITFEEKASWSAMLEMAREQNKIVFVDAYATWCGPCKMMDRNVFPDEALSAYFDEHFINVKIDMESERGEPFGADYEVDAYPTLFFIGPDGTVLKKQVGMTEAPDLLAIGKYIVDPTSSPVGALQKRFEDGERDTALLKSLAIESFKLGSLHEEAARLLILATDPAVVSTEVDYFILLYNMEFLPDSELGVYFSDHFEALLGTFDRYVYEKLSDVIIAHLTEGVEKEQTDTYFKSARAYVEKTVTDQEVKEALLKGIDEVRNSLP